MQGGNYVSIVVVGSSEDSREESIKLVSMGAGRGGSDGDTF